jgi:Mn-dependent DtxR family transcriptional regulator
MNFEAVVLRVTFDLARRHKPILESEIAVLLEASPSAVRDATLRLQADELVLLRADGSVRLTMAGLACAVSVGSGQGSARMRPARLSRAA